MKLANGNFYRDLSFKEIWDILEQKILTTTEDKQIYFKFLISLFYRMAFMVDHELVENKDLDVETVKFKNGINSTHCNKKFSNFYSYKPDNRVLDFISTIFGDFDGISLEAFLIYNDLLAFNEDCKYYYRMNLDKEKEKWISNIGRVNTILTHASVVMVHKNLIKFSELLIRASRTRGVAPCTNQEIRTYCSSLIDE